MPLVKRTNAGKMNKKFKLGTKRYKILQNDVQYAFSVVDTVNEKLN